MTGLGPELADRTADMARADNADLDLWARGRLTQCGYRSQHFLHDQCSRSGQ